MINAIQAYCTQLSTSFADISNERKIILEKISSYINDKSKQQLPIELVYICTHNSRRSHFGQVWAAVAAAYYGINKVYTYSGGTEATAFNPNAIEALRHIGFEITDDGAISNPRYTVKFGANEQTTCFSKVYNHPQNPIQQFAAIMTCSDAEQNCPFIPGAEIRVGTTYEDPKIFDGTPLQERMYAERSRQIALECLYVFSKVKSA
jgi:arsenate reductase (thioredoxin)